MKFSFNPVVLETFARLLGFQSFLETMNDGIPVVQERENRYLKQVAAEEGWEAQEYFAEEGSLNHQFCTWVPTFAAYSATILLHSIVETQLHAFAEYMGKQQNSKLRIKDLAGKGVDQSVNYLQRVLSINTRVQISFRKSVEGGRW